MVTAGGSVKETIQLSAARELRSALKIESVHWATPAASRMGAVARQ
jgi:hypothetical protein